MAGSLGAQRTLLALALFACFLAGSCARRAHVPTRVNVLLVTVDTLRADRLSALGAARPTTPELDALAADGLAFTHAQSPRAKTTPALASLMSGLYPHDHGVRDLAAPLAADVPLLAETLRAAGWRTGAIVGNFVLKRELAGLARGFERWIEELPDLGGVPPDGVAERKARSLTDGALALLGLAGEAPGLAGEGPGLARADGPWFLWLHYMDPHGSYDPPPEHRVFATGTPDPIPPAAQHAEDGARQARWIAEYNVPAEARLADGTIDAARVRDLYDGEVHYVDAEIGRLLARLRAAGRLADTLVVVTADHGESLGEHDYWFEHGRDAYEASCRVPLVVRFPDAWPRRPAPGRRAGDVSLADLAPTLLELLELPALPPRRAPSERPESTRGRSLAREWLDGDERPRAVFCEKVERAEVSLTVQTKAVRLGDWKLLRRYTQRDRAAGGRELVVLSEELYDLGRDPAETESLIARPPPHAPLWRLRAELLGFARADVHFADLAELLQRGRAELARDDPETLRMLEALGY